MIQPALNQSVFFARLLLPQIFFYGLYTVLQQVLNSREHFALPMFAPLLNNLVMIATAILFIYIAHDVTVSSSFTNLTDESIEHPETLLNPSSTANIRN